MDGNAHTGEVRADKDVMLEDAEEGRQYQEESYDDRVVGRCEQEEEDEAGRHLVTTLKARQMSLVNTFFNAGKMFYGPKGGTTRPDYIVGPTAWITERRVK